MFHNARFLFLLLPFMTVAALSAQVASRTDGVTVFYYDSLYEAFAASAGVSVDSPDEVTLLADVVLDEPLTVDEGKYISLVPGGAGFQGSPLTIRRGANLIDFPVIWVNGEPSSLSLGKPGMEFELIIDGGRLDSPPIAAHCPLISLCGSGSKLIMYDKVTLQNNCNNGSPSGGSYYENGAGVFIRTGVAADDSERQAEFIMKGGTIRGNINAIQTSMACGGGVFIAGFGIFSMEGGVIMDNTAHQGGGVYLHGVGSFNKTGGIIYGANAPVGYRNTAMTGLDTPPCYGHAVAVGTVSHLLGKYRYNTVGENDNLSYIWNPQEDGIFGKGEKWDTPGKALLRMLLAVILPVLALVIFVLVILRIRYIKKLKKEVQEAADTAANAVANAALGIDLEAMGLTRREREICELLLTNRPLKEIAGILELTYAGANFHAQNLYKKLGIENRTELLVRVRKGQ